MNGSYGSLKEEDTDNNEITNDKELRKMKKKLRKINQNDIEGIRKLEILIDEYENRTTEIKEETKDKTKAKSNAKAKEDESNGFLEKEYQKNKARNAKKYAEEYAEQERVKEQKKKSDEEKRKEKAERQRARELHLPDTDKIIQDHGLKKINLPSDILEIIYDYSHKLWKKLSLKYHPDKYDGGDTYSKLLNSLKDNH
jgi:hypothetical protein